MSDFGLIVAAMLADALATWRLMRAFGHGRYVTARAILRHVPGDWAWYKAQGRKANAA